MTKLGLPPRVATAAVLVLALTGVAMPGQAGRRGCEGGMASIRGRFCIDRYEAYLVELNSRGKVLRRHSPYEVPKAGKRYMARSRRHRVPQAYVSRDVAARACREAGKRLCTAEEWLTACQGKHPTAYPYGKDRVPGRCNDKGVSPLRKLHGKDDHAAFGYQGMNDPRLNRISGTVRKTGASRRCRSSFGTYDMVGNLHEWTAEAKGVFRGGYYLDVTLHGDGCHYKTSAHSGAYHDYSTGFRCCADPGPLRRPTRAAKKPRKKASPRGRRGAVRTYVVEKGDSLWGIAHHFQITVDALRELNGLGVKSRPIRPGQKLRIPR